MVTGLDVFRAAPADDGVDTAWYREDDLRGSDLRLRSPSNLRKSAKSVDESSTRVSKPMASSALLGVSASAVADPCVPTCPRVCRGGCLLPVPASLCHFCPRFRVLRVLRGENPVYDCARRRPPATRCYLVTLLGCYVARPPPVVTLSAVADCFVVTLSAAADRPRPLPRSLDPSIPRSLVFPHPPTLPRLPIFRSYRQGYQNRPTHA